MNEEDEQSGIREILFERERDPDFGPVRGLMGKAFLKVTGWSVETMAPDVPKGVIVAAPHTSSWDLTIMLAISYSMRMRLKWMGRRTMFSGIGGVFLKQMGGIPVDRTTKRNVVQQMVDEFNAAERLLLVVAPEGRLRKTDYWKSGFYHIARGADVPIGLSFLDYERKAGGVGAVFKPTGDVKKDMDFIRKFYQNIPPKNAHYLGPVRLKEE